MSQDLEINRAVLERLRAARKRRGLTQQAAADELNVSRTTIVAIEKGERSLKPEELVRLAEIYRVPVSDLVRASRPPTDFAVEFRLSPSQEALGEEMDRAVSLLQKLADDYVELERIAGVLLDRDGFPPTRRIAGKPYAFGHDLAHRERTRLGIGDGPVLRLRELLDADVGIRTFALPLPGGVAGLYIYSDSHGPCVAINANHPHERQRWSLAHEYAHFLTSREKPEITILQQFIRVPADERMADAFAEAFLVPRSRLTKRVHDIQREREGISPADLLTLAAYFEVSFQAVALSMEDARLLPSGSLDRLTAQGFRPEEGRELLDLGTAKPDTRLLPPRYERLAIQAYWSGALSEEELGQFLHLDRVSARRRASELGRGVGLDNEGEHTTFELESLTELDLLASRGK